LIEYTSVRVPGSKTGRLENVIRVGIVKIISELTKIVLRYGCAIPQ
jgi:hypothetical protein